ncbi:MAG: hypothetical protein MR353_08865 [Spirochaetia bacterium]|nr:hypothetical protein [Spirochaetia bacterium]MDD7767667.1 hypothetical protein [Treponema sp.]
MKKIALIFVLFLLSFAAFAEKITFQTGDSFGVSNTDYFYPKDISFTGSKCTVSSIKKVEDNLWCLTLTAPKSANTQAPVIFEFYIKKGDVLKMRRLTNPMEECKLKVISVNWNEITFEAE